MTKIIYFEYCALAIEVLILVSVYQRNMLHGFVNRWYVAVISTITLATITDIISMWLEMAEGRHIIANYLANTVCLWSTAINAGMLCGYLFAQTGLFFRLAKRPMTKLILFVPAILITLLMFVINPINKMIFYIDSDGKYARGNHVAFLYTLAFVYVGMGLIVTLQFKRIYNARKIASILLLLFSSVIGTVIQIVFPTVIIQMFVTACAALILLLEVQAPEERMHVASGLNSMNAYSFDIKKLYDTKTDFGDVIAVITNFNVLTDMLGYFNLMSIVRQISDRIVAMTSGFKLEAEHYYLGDGRFAVIVDYMNIARQKEIAEAINTIFSDAYHVGASEVKLLANVCSITCPEVIDNPEFLISFDERLAQEPYSGELRFGEQIFNKKEFEFKQDFADVIDNAFSDGNFSIVYQPVMSVTSGRFNHAEAFLRLNDPVYGYIPPDEVIREAEKSSAIYAITSYVLEEVCKLICRPEFLYLGIDYIEINLSPAQLVWNDLVSIVLSTIRSYHVQPKNLCFDITDVDDINSYNRMKNNICALSELGFGIIMDDFGSGVFEIERVARLPLSGVKLDRDFVRKGFTEDNIKILKGTCRMVMDMGLETGAIGVENEAAELALKNMGVTYLQGYNYCRPLAMKEFIDFILKGGKII